MGACAMTSLTPTPHRLQWATAAHWADYVADAWARLETGGQVGICYRDPILHQRTEPGCLPGDNDHPLLRELEIVQIAQRLLARVRGRHHRRLLAVSRLGAVDSTRPHRDVEVWGWHRLRGLSQREVARRMGVTQPRVCQIVREVDALVEEALADHDRLTTFRVV